ncbi:MAG: hypothetical protein AAFV90_14520 [Cyanobacteria bacterium J06634_5]
MVHPPISEQSDSEVSGKASSTPASDAAPKPVSRTVSSSATGGASSFDLSSPQMTFDSWRLYFRAFVKGAAGFALALMAWEGILQLTVESRRGATMHPALGKIENPGLMLSSKEGFSRTRLNSLGMRAPELAPKTPSEYRILMLGDSYTRGDEVSDGLNFSDRLQAVFEDGSDAQNSQADNATQPTTVQIINAGKPSASPASYLYAADFFRQTFAPDATVIQLTESDLLEDMTTSASEFYVEKVAGNVDADSVYEVSRNEDFGSVDPLAQAITKYAPFLKPLKQMSVLRVGGRNFHASVSPTEPYEDESFGMEEALALYAEDADLARWTVHQLNQQFPNLVLVFIPAMNYQDWGEVSSEPRNASLENALTVAAEAQSVPLLNMRSDFRAHYRTQGTHLRGFNNTLPGEGHLNAKGHALIANRLIELYRDRLDSDSENTQALKSDALATDVLTSNNTSASEKK